MNTTVHPAIDTRGKPARILRSAGQEAECAYTMRLNGGLPVRVLCADRRKRKEARRYNTEL
ncbi:MAG: hypothetical protein LBP19_00610 [Treponema sp.]|nr:hypothetical protein [Treponema sp.]